MKGCIEKFTKLSVSSVTYVCSNNGLATLSHRQNGVMEKLLRNSVAFYNNPIPKDPKGLGTSFCLRKRCQAVIGANRGITRYSQFCELFV